MLIPLGVDGRLGGLIFGVGLLLAGCQGKVKKPLEEAAAAYVPIFTQNREFTYLVSRFSGSKPFIVDTVLLEAV